MDIKMDKDIDMGLVTEEVSMFMDKRKAQIYEHMYIGQDTSSKIRLQDIRYQHKL